MVGKQFTEWNRLVSRYSVDTSEFAAGHQEHLCYVSVCVCIRYRECSDEGRNGKTGWIGGDGSRVEKKSRPSVDPCGVRKRQSQVWERCGKLGMPAGDWMGTWQWFVFSVFLWCECLSVSSTSPSAPALRPEGQPKRVETRGSR